MPSMDEIYHDPEFLTEIRELMRFVNIQSISLEYSGGNDQGGIDSIEVHQVGESEPVFLSEHGDNQTELRFNPYTKQWTSFVPFLEVDEAARTQLIKTLIEPVYDEYGSFAGPFSTSGTITCAFGEQFGCKFSHNYSEDEEDEYDEDFAYDSAVDRELEQ